MSGGFGLDNIVFTSDKRCRPTWSTASQYKLRREAGYEERLAPDKETVMSAGGVSYEGDIKPRATFTDVVVRSVEECARYCTLGMACTAFQYRKNDKHCIFVAHTSVKEHPLHETVVWTGSENDMVYILECSASLETEVAGNTDWFTHTRADWQEVSDCPAGHNGATGIIDVRSKAKLYHAQVHGYQYSAAAKCDVPHTYYIQKTITSASLDTLGLTQEYIAQIKPAAYVRSFAKVIATAATPNAYKIEMTLADGTSKEAIIGKLKRTEFSSSSEIKDAMVTLPLASLPLGDFTIKSHFFEKGSGTLVTTPPELRVDLPLEMGCYTASEGFDDEVDDEALTKTKCILQCHAETKRFAFITKGKHCFCKDESVLQKLKLVQPEECSSTCSGAPLSLCGGPSSLLLLVAECEQGWTRFGDSCFQASPNNSMNDLDAFDHCGDLGSTLWFPESAEETEFVSTIFWSVNLTICYLKLYF